MKIAVVPSNQHRNVAGGDPNPAPGITTEEQIQVVSAQEAVAEFVRQGHTAQMFWIPGVGTESVDELLQMMDLVMDWQPTHSLSLHSNSGSGVQYLYPLYGRTEDLAFAQKFGHEAAPRLGFNYRSPTYRTDLTYFTHTKVLGPGRTLLSETGEHQTAVDAKYLWQYARYNGIMLARSFIKATGAALNYDGPVSGDVAVPAGAQFDKYRPGGSSVPAAPTYTRLLKLTDPFMHGNDVLWVQKQLVKAGFNIGVHGADNIYGPDTRNAVIAFQKRAWPSYPSEWDGIVGPKTWSKLLLVQ